MRIGKIIPALICFIFTGCFTVGTAAAYDHTFSSYAGPSTCVNCHYEQALEMFGTNHYQWTGPTPNVPNIDGYAGKGDVGFNTYCGAVVSSRRFACSGCHVGYGGAPKPELSRDQLNNIDCLTCHQEIYRRKPAPPFEAVTFTGHDGIDRTWTLPVEDEKGGFRFIPDEAAMGVSALQAAQSVHLPTRTSCLSCHAYAAGSDCGKRGDISSQTANPPVSEEVHMSPQGQDMTCLSCHVSEDHRVMGRGLDLRANERPGLLTCLTGGCHTDTPHLNQQLDRHTGRVACQTCHIPVFANLASTEMDRDWLNPFFAQGLFGGQGGFKPEEIRDSDVIPTYRWFDGTSYVYALGQPAVRNSEGIYELGLPNGSVRVPGAKIYPMKEHFSNSSLHEATGEMIPFSTFTYFVTGDFNRAVTDGQAYSGLTGPWRLVEAHTFQTINHGVKPSDNALRCGACHGSLAGGPVRMNLQGELGYELSGPRSEVCVQCHSQEENKPFLDLHTKHVTSKKIDCSRCHNFTRQNDVAPAKDAVFITHATYDPVAKSLTVTATSSDQPNVALSAENLGPLNWKSWLGIYRNTFYNIPNAPANVTVNSSGGGWQTRSAPYPATDGVSIRSVYYNAAAKTLTIAADSTDQPDVQLTAKNFGSLAWKSWLGLYRNTFTGVSILPESILVTSSNGGWETVTVPRDTVKIERVTYNPEGGGTLTVVATSNQQPNVTLTATNYGTLAWKSWLTLYRTTFTGIGGKPATVTVISSGGGSATHPVP